MLNEQMTMLILSCERYSDLWDGHVKALENNWGDRGMKTFIVTEKGRENGYDNVSFIAAGDGEEWSEKLKAAVEKVDTEYVFLTLDDYYITKKVSNDEIENILSVMKELDLDYVRLYKRPTRAKGDKIKGHKGFYWIKNELVYSLNLFSGIWKKSFLQKTFDKPRNIWSFEVSLSRIATQTNARCVVSLNNEFKIIDVVMKGQLKNKANRYVKKHKLYNGNRTVMSKWAEFKFSVRLFGARHAPRWIVKKARAFMMKRGHHYFSQENE